MIRSAAAQMMGLMNNDLDNGSGRQQQQTTHMQQQLRSSDRLSSANNHHHHTQHQHQFQGQHQNTVSIDWNINNKYLDLRDGRLFFDISKITEGFLS